MPSTRSEAAYQLGVNEPLVPSHAQASACLSSGASSPDRAAGFGEMQSALAEDQLALVNETETDGVRLLANLDPLNAAEAERIAPFRGAETAELRAARP